MKQKETPMSDEQPVYQPNASVQALAKEAIWVQGFSRAVVQNGNLSQLVPVEIEMLTRLAKALFTLGEQSLTYDAWKQLEATAAFGATVAKEVEILRSAQSTTQEGQSDA